MPDFTVLDHVRMDPAPGAEQYGSAITASATVNTKGSAVAFWSSVSETTPFDADGIIVHVGGGSAAAKFLIDVVLTTGADDVRIANIPYATPAAATRGGYNVLVPIHVPVGSTVSVKCQSNVASATVDVQLTLVKGGFAAPLRLGRATTYGAETGDSTGISVDPGATANTKGVWAVLTTSTTNPIRWLILMLTGQANTTRIVGAWRLDVGIGASGQEQVVVPDILVAESTSGDNPYPQAIAVPVSIPAGSRLVVRSQSDITDAADRLLDVVILGVD